MKVNTSIEEQEPGYNTRNPQMSDQHVLTRAGNPSNALATGLHGRWLLLARISWIALVVITLTIFFASLPLYMAQLRTPCVGTACQYQQLTPEQEETLKGIGMTLGNYTAYLVAFALANMVLCLGVSTLIFWHRSDDRMAMLVALMLVTLGPISVMATFPPSSPSPWLVPNRCLLFLFLTLFLLVFCLFPSGQFVPRWTRWAFVVILVVQIPANFFPDVPLIPNSLSGQLGWLVSVGEFVTLALVQLYRYRRVSNPLQKQQTKWVVFGIAVPVVVNVVVTALDLLFPSLAEHSSFYLLVFNESGFLLALFAPLAFGFAILRYRLWEIDTIINRTLVYGLLTIIVVGVYVLIVSILGRLLQTTGNFLISLLATGLIAVLFQPLRARLQRGVNRLMYGERDEPYAVLSRLASRLEATLAPDLVLPTIVETVAQALKLPYVAIAMKKGDQFSLTASYGSAQEKPFILPLVYHTETIGQLLLAPRVPGETFTASDQRLLEDIAHQAGVAVHAVSLSADLQSSREQLITAREEERRRLRRDLHDGLGSTLAALHLQAGAIRNMMRYDLPAADAELVDLQTEIRSSIADIRRLVYELRPPTLDELGLVGAIQQFAAQCNMGSEADGTSRNIDANLHVIVEETDQLPVLPAAVEVAAYRIAQEALTNVVRHAHACNCAVRLSLLDGFRLEITDDGVGLSTEQHAGVGLLSMRERATEVGGTCEIEPTPGHGTRVLVKLPLPKE
jgi:signal transduction histidine kinase